MDDASFILVCDDNAIVELKNESLGELSSGVALSQAHINCVVRDDCDTSVLWDYRLYKEFAAQYRIWKSGHGNYIGLFYNSTILDLGDAVYGDRTFGDGRMPAPCFILPELVRILQGESVRDYFIRSVGIPERIVDFIVSYIDVNYPDIGPHARQYLAGGERFANHCLVLEKALFDACSSFIADLLQWFELLDCPRNYSRKTRGVCYQVCSLLYELYFAYLLGSGYEGVQARSIKLADNPLCKGDYDATENRAAIISFGSLTRGGGKLYCEIHSDAFDKQLSASSFQVSSVTSDGIAVPAKVVLRDNRAALVLQVFDDNQEVSISYRDRSGEVRAYGSHTFNSTMSALTSKFNTLLRNEAALSLRNCDRMRLPDETKLVVSRYIVGPAGSSTVHGALIIPGNCIIKGDPCIELQAYGARGAVISDGEYACSNDRVDKSFDCWDANVRTVDFSLRIPTVHAFGIWAHFPYDSNRDDFIWFDEGAVQALRDRWLHAVEPACNERFYDDWFRTKHRSMSHELEMQKYASFGYKPLFSIVVPLYHTPLPYYEEMIASVFAQTYEGWELILVNASCGDRGLCAAVDATIRAEPRVKEIRLETNLGITENTLAGIEVAQGEFICFLDHDDLLEPDVLYWYAKAVNESDNIDLLYCDEDKFDGRAYSQPFFKPDWDPELLLGMNYVCHFLAVRASIIHRLAPYGKEYDGAQDWYLTLGVGALARGIYHAPKVLYHWRIHETSTASSSAQKDYVLESSKRALESYLLSRDVDGIVTESPMRPYRFVVNHRTPEPKVSIIIPNRDSISALNRCLHSIRDKTCYANYEVVIAENSSARSETFEYYKLIERISSHVRVINVAGTGEHGQSCLLTRAAEAARGEFLLFLSSNIEVITPDWIEQLMGPFLNDTGVGATGAKLLFPDDTIQHAGMFFSPTGPCNIGIWLPSDAPGNMDGLMVARDVPAVTGACLMTRRDVFFAVEGIDERLRKHMATLITA